MTPTHRSSRALPVDRHWTAYVLLAGVAGGLVLAVAVLACCKLCLRRKKPSRDFKEFDPEDFLERGLSQSWAAVATESGQGGNCEDFEMTVLTRGKPSTKSKHIVDRCKDKGLSQSPESPPEVTSVVRRRSSVGIQRQASVCLSDEEDLLLEPNKILEESDEASDLQKSSEFSFGDVTRISAIVHQSCNENFNYPSVCSSKSQPIMRVYHPLFLHDNSQPNSGSHNVIQNVHLSGAISLHKFPDETLTRVVDLEDYHYSRQQVWELATQGETFLKEQSQSKLDVTDSLSPIQQSASTEAGILEHGLEQHQVEHLCVLLHRYSPIDEDDAKIWNKVRYNDTGSREDIREEVLDIISGESSDDSHSSGESEILKQQSRDLWELRANLEKEEDKLSDTQDIVDMQDVVESAENLVYEEECSGSHLCSSCCDPYDEYDGNEYLQFPSHEIRRHSYKSLFNHRKQIRTGGTEGSYDSIESTATDRTDGATTSFESITDSTGEGQTNRLQQMKADSGYKSMESTGKAPRLCRKDIQFTEGESVDQMTTMEGTFEEEIEVLFKNSGTLDSDNARKPKSIEGKVVSFEGITFEHETLPASEPQLHKNKFKSALKKHSTTGDFECSEPKVNSSLFQRFFRSGRLRLESLRDYSIDEKSDALFREFSRIDSEGMRKRIHSRLHCRSADPPRLSIEEEESETHIPVICLSCDNAPV